MNPALQPDAMDAHRVSDAVLAVDQEILHQGVDDGPVRGDGHHQLGGVDDPIHFRGSNLPFLDHDNAVAVKALDMGAGHAGVHRADFTTRHGFGFLHGLPDGLDGAVDVDDDALP